MTNPVIRVEKLGPRYFLGRQQRGPRSRAVGDDLMDALKASLRLRVADAGVTLTSVLANDEEAWVEIEAEVTRLDPTLNVGYAIYTGSNELVYWSCHTDAAPPMPRRLAPGRDLLRTRLPRRLLNEGTYRIELIGSVHHRFWILKPSAHVPTIYFEVRGGLSESPFWNTERPGRLAPVLLWETAA